MRAVALAVLACLVLGLLVAHRQMSIAAAPKISIIDRGLNPERRANSPLKSQNKYSLNAS